MLKLSLPAGAVLVFLSVSVVSAADRTVDVQELGILSMQELMNETVTSVSKREQNLFDTASAVSVITNEDLRRSGVTSIADALRMVPGMNVGSVNSSQWAISARGFNNVYANKLLVMVDGRAIYTPLIAGVDWDAEQTMLEDVDRVEVIRGPGATVWGANAVNGVINIVTRSARDTQGSLIYASVGDLEETNSGVRYGGRLGEQTYYRVFASTLIKDDFPLANGQPADDSWRAQNSGIRIDHYPDDETQLTWQGGGTGVESDNGVLDSLNLNTLGRLTKSWSDRSSFELQAYYDHSTRDISTEWFTRMATMDISAQNTFGLGERNDVVWGLGYRRTDIHLGERNFSAIIRDEHQGLNLYNIFVQDELQIVPDKLIFTAGVKLEHNDFTGFEVQPSVRLVFKPTPRHTFWGAVSRTVRTPAAYEGMDLVAILAGPPSPGPGGGLYFPRIVGNTDFDSETMIAHELGYRVRATDRIGVDVAGFYNTYDHLLSLPRSGPYVPGVPFGTQELAFFNHTQGVIYGAEVEVTFAASPTWKLSAAYSWMRADLPGYAPANPYERSSPETQLVFRSSYAFSPRLTIDGQLRYMDNLYGVPAYLTADVRIGYRVTESIEVAVVGLNLLDNQHPEATSFYLAPAAEVPRSVHAKITWRF